MPYKHIDSDFNLAIVSCAVIDPFILQAWVSLHTVLKTANLKSRQQHFVSKPSNMFAKISACMVIAFCKIFSEKNQF